MDALKLGCNVRGSFKALLNSKVATIDSMNTYVPTELSAVIFVPFSGDTQLLLSPDVTPLQPPQGQVESLRG